MNGKNRGSRQLSGSHFRKKIFKATKAASNYQFEIDALSPDKLFVLIG